MPKLYLSLILGLTATWHSAADAAEWRVGTARTDITPSGPIWMGGYAVAQPSVGRRAPAALGQGPGLRGPGRLARGHRHLGLDRHRSAAGRCGLSAHLPADGHPARADRDELLAHAQRAGRRRRDAPRLRSERASSRPRSTTTPRPWQTSSCYWSRRRSRTCARRGWPLARARPLSEPIAARCAPRCRRPPQTAQPRSTTACPCWWSAMRRTLCGPCCSAMPATARPWASTRSTATIPGLRRRPSRPAIRAPRRCSWPAAGPT